MEAHEISDLVKARTKHGEPYLEFLCVSAMSGGIYVLPSGGPDPQTPHSEDEVYYVVRGRRKIRVGDEDRVVRPGSIVFVPAGTDHRFHDISEDLVTLVFFAPAERSLGNRAAAAGR